MFKLPDINYANHSAYGQLFGRKKFLNRLRALKRIEPQCRRHAKEYIRHVVFAYIPTQNTDMAICKKLADDGVVAFRLNEVEISTIYKMLSGILSELRQSKDNIPLAKRSPGDKRSFVEKSDVAGLYDYIRQAARSRGIFEAIKWYKGKVFDIAGIYVQISDPADPDVRNHFADMGLEDPKTAYMHVDSTFRRLKLLIYLNDIRKENGPFSYVLGSHRLKRGFLECVTRSATHTSGLFHSKTKWRELFWSLPKFLQKKAEFGNDLSDDSPEALALLTREKVFTSEDGNLFLFDTDGIHRGGIVETGNRINLQVLLEPEK